MVTQVVNKNRFWLAQANIARMLAPLDDPVMSEFVRQLEYVNSVADRSPGFVWRLQTPEGDATAIRVFEEPQILLNMSVWETLESLYDFTYRSDHLTPFRNRRQWFTRMEGAHLVLWWLPADQLPSPEQARERFDLLNRIGPSPNAFTFKHPFSPAGVEIKLRDGREWTFQ